MNARRLVFLVGLVAVVAAPLYGQEGDTLVDTYITNFDRAQSVQTRLAIVRDASTSQSEALGPFFHEAVDYVISQSDRIRVDEDLRALAETSVEEIGERQYGQAASSLWTLFEDTDHVGLHLEILDALGAVGRGERTVVRKMAAYLESQNTLLGTDQRPSEQIVQATVAALGRIGDPVAFDALFGARTLGYSASVQRTAQEALRSLSGDLKELIIGAIQRGNAAQRREALTLGLESDTIDERGKAEIAEAALRSALAAGTASLEERRVNREVRRTAVERLEELRWSRATDLVIRHFGAAALEYDRGTVTAGYLVDAIDGLGAMGTHEAAERLTLYLELLNSYREHGQPYEEQIVLAVIRNIERLGDKVAFANLSYVQYLDYSDTVRQAARRAIDALKW